MVPMTQETKPFSLVPCCFADDDDGGRPIGTSRSRPNGVVVPPIGRASRWPWYADSFHARHSDARHHRPFFLLFFFIVLHWILLFILFRVAFLWLPSNISLNSRPNSFEFFFKNKFATIQVNARDWSLDPLTFQLRTRDFKLCNLIKIQINWNLIKLASA